MPRGEIVLKGCWTTNSWPASKTSIKPKLSHQIAFQISYLLSWVDDMVFQVITRVVFDHVKSKESYKMPILSIGIATNSIRLYVTVCLCFLLLNRKSLHFVVRAECCVWVATRPGRVESCSPGRGCWVTVGTAAPYHTTAYTVAPLTISPPSSTSFRRQRNRDRRPGRCHQQPAVSHLSSRTHWPTNKISEIKKSGLLITFVANSLF